MENRKTDHWLALAALGLILLFLLTLGGCAQADQPQPRYYPYQPAPMVGYSEQLRRIEQHLQRMDRQAGWQALQARQRYWKRERRDMRDRVFERGSRSYFKRKRR